MDYTPFLKLKVNEIAALNALPLEDKRRLSPFFDLPRKDVLTSQSLKALIDTAYRKYEINLTALPFFYLDNYDINDDILVGGDNCYLYALEVFSNANVIPVVGIDRSARRNEVVVLAKKNNLVQNDTVALRIGSEDIVSYKLVEEELLDLLGELNKYFKHFHLVIDNRICHNIDINARAAHIIKFVNDIREDIKFDKVIMSGSSITASIKDLLDPHSRIIFERYELILFAKVQNEIDEVFFGDYTVVSPNYSDVHIPGEYMRKVTAPKLIYIFDNLIHIVRGGSIEGHPRGNKQYNDLAATLIAEPFFRGGSYSFGDKYIDEKANNVGSDATPSTVPKALINAHISYMIHDFI